ncbi:transposase [Ralstonia pseudosolanacearum]|uniref:IS66-like element accessory protein TnpA n=1 Tax=Ralstonia pseudosolanacearum TaxID=1310165 RepID=UPI0025B3C12E|nr:transposase [Ralstonia pseudosolanacearum]MDN3370311.1 transposase [Ralstonia pseudosolanacearum]
MTETEVDYLPLRVKRVRINGKREFDAESKRRLIEACMQPGASISGMALKAGINANQLHKWIRMHERAVAAALDNAESAAPAFIPVVAVDEIVVPTSAAPEPASMVRAESIGPAARAEMPARLSARLPNGVTLALECGAQDTGLVRAMIEALGGR